MNEDLERLCTLDGPVGRGRARLNSHPEEKMLAVPSWGTQGWEAGQG